MSNTNFEGSSWLPAFARRRSPKLGAMLGAAGKLKKLVKSASTDSNAKRGDAVLLGSLPSTPFTPMQDLENRVMMTVFTWDGSSSGDWNTKANWDKNAVPGNDDIAVFPASAVGTKTITLSSNAEVEQIVFLGSGYSISGKTINLDSDTDNKSKDDKAGGGGPGVYTKVSGTGTNSISSDILLGDSGKSVAFTFSADASDTLTISGDIDDGTTVTHDIVASGAGTILFTTANGFDGTATVSSGTTLIISADLALGNNYPDSATGATTVVSGGTFGFKGGIVYTIAPAFGNVENFSIAGTGVGGVGALVNVSGTNSFNGPIAMTANSTIGTTAGSLTLSGVISGGFGLTSIGAGTLTLSATETYTKTTTVSSGTLIITGSIAASSGVALSSTGVIGGTGKTSGITGTGGKIDPGLVGGTGKLGTGNIATNSSTAFEFDINGITAGTQYDQLNVTGTVSLGNATLTIDTIQFAVGKSFTLIDNDGSDAVTGTFNGLAEGAQFSAGGNIFKISYVGGSGNDVVITTVSGNTAPVITSDLGGASASISVAEGQTAVTTVQASDADGDTRTYSISGGADSGFFQINSSTGALTFASARDFETKADAGANNVYDVDVTAADGKGGSDVQSIAVTITDINDETPVITTTTFSSPENATSTGGVTATDKDAGSVLDYTIVGGADQSLFDIDSGTGALTFKSAPDFENPSDVGKDNVYDVDVKVSDGLNSSSASISVTVTDLNDETPVITSTGSYSVPENTTPVGTLSASDADAGTTFEYSIFGGVDSAKFGINTSTGALFFLSAPDFESPTDTGGNNVYDVTVGVSDGSNSSSKDIAVTVTDANDQDPAITSTGVYTVPENTTAIGTVTASDADAGTSFTYSISGGVDQSFFSIDSSSGALTFITGRDFEIPSDSGANNVYDVNVQVSDGLHTATKGIEVTVINGNDAPTDLTLSNNIVNENLAIGTIVGSFSGTDPDPANTFTYSLVSGAGSTDNASFTIDGSGNLLTAEVFNFEAKSNYFIRVRVTDQGSLTYEKQLGVSVVNVNEVPTDVALSSNTIAEDQPSGSTVGTLSSTDPDGAQTFTYSLVSGGGSADNSSFTIVGNELRTNTALNFSSKSSYSIRVRSTDQGSLTFDKIFTINITSVNLAPTDIILSSNTITENSAVGTTVGSFSSVDPNSGNTFTYTLVSGAGSDDNASFTIDGSGNLKANAVFDYETKITYNIRVRTTDQGSLSYEKPLSISIINVNESPTDVVLSSNTIAENLPVGTTIGTLSGTDVDAADTFTYTLVSGAGSTDNASFTIENGILKSSAIFDYEAKSAYAVRVRATDQGGLSFEKQLSISVVNVNETPTDISLSSSSVADGQAVGTTVGTFGATDPDAGSTFLFTLVSGTGSTDNASFTIDGAGHLKTNAIFDFSSQSSYFIRVAVTDQGSLSFEKQFTITVIDAGVNVAPSNISLTPAVVAENEPAGTIVGAFSSEDANWGDTFTYSLVVGSGDTDNGSFAIDENGNLVTAVSFDFETKHTYLIRVRTTDQSDATFDKEFTINVGDVNEEPTDISLSQDTLAENEAAGTTVGSFSTTDADGVDTFTYSLVAGTGSEDNGSFAIDGDNLVTAASFDFEGQSTFSIRVRTTDSGGLSFDKQLTIHVGNVNDAPTSVELSNSTIQENQPIGTTVGSFSTTDPDAANTFTYELVEGEGSTDNASFTIDENGNLQSAAIFSLAGQTSYSVRVRTTDQGSLFTEQTFTVTVSVVNDPPTLTFVDTLVGASEDTAFTITYADLAAASNKFDANGDVISFRITSVSSGTLTKNGLPVVAGITRLGEGEELVWTPDSNANGTLAAFTVKAFDGLAASDTAVQVSINVGAVNDAPTLTTVTALTGAIQNEPFTITFATLAAAANEADVDGDALSFHVKSVTSGTLTKNGVPVTAGTVVTTGDSLVWTPNTDETGTRAAFTIVAFDGSLESNPATLVSVTVAPQANTAPTLTTVSTLTGALEDAPFTITYADLATAANEADGEGDTLSFRIESVTSGTLTKGGVAVVPGTTLLGVGESLVWTPASNANGTIAAFTIKAFDGALASATAVPVSVAVTPVNDAPTLTTVNTLTGAVENKSFTITYASLAAAANEADIDGNALSFRIETLSSGTLTKNGIAVVPGTTLLSTGESLVWTPAVDVSGVIGAFTVKAFDGTAASDTAVQVSADVAIRYTHDITPGKTTSKFTYTDSQGHLVTVTLGGKVGTLHLIRAVPDGEAGDLLELVGASTDTKTSITFKLSGKGLTTNVSDILIATPIGKLTAGPANVSGALSIGGDASTLPSTIKLGAETSLDFVTGQGIKSLTLVAWNGGSLNAPYINTFKVSGIKNALSGDLNAALHLTQADPAKFNINNLTVAGTFSGSLTSSGKINGITVGILNNANIYIETVLGLDGLATSSADFTSAPTTPTLAKLTVKGVAGQPGFIDSVIDAWNIGKLDLKTVTTTNGGTALGVAADKIASIKFLAAGVNDGKAISLSKLDLPADLDGTGLPAGDFKITLL